MSWSVREPPLPICGVFAAGDIALALAGRLAQSDAAVEVFLGHDAIIAVGGAEALLWVDGAVWLGRDGQMLCPTMLRSSVPSDLVVSAARGVAEVDGVVVSMPGRTMILQRPAGKLDRSTLAEFARQGAGR